MNLLLAMTMVYSFCASKNILWKKCYECADKQDSMRMCIEEKKQCVSALYKEEQKPCGKNCIKAPYSDNAVITSCFSEVLK